MAYDVMPQSRRSATISGTWLPGRNDTVVAPRRRRRTFSIGNGWTETTTSAVSRARSSTEAPASTYSSSAMRAAAPAFGSTATA